MYLIEIFPGETREQLRAALNAMYAEWYPTVPIWEGMWDISAKYKFKDKEFVRVITRTGLMQEIGKRAKKGQGINRDFLHLGSRNHENGLWCVHRGQETKHEMAEIQKVAEAYRFP